ncbi:MAG: orotate phosphoribosyltransferase [Planctomycetes bacterium]|nr:orotate phosphoribosyltransferase [Planctomycetota bacterium]
MTTIYPPLDLAAARRRLLGLIREKALRRGTFTLASGKTSDYYLDCRLVTLDPEGLYLMSRLILHDLAGAGVEAVGGLTLGADPIAAGVAVLSHLEGRPVRAFIVRKETKAHGTQKRIEGSLEPGARVAIVEDVMTTGGSAKQAIEEVEKAGAKVVKVYCLIDRLEGGGQDLRARGYDVKALFEVPEVVTNNSQNLS